jgi:hypothetical protein
VASDGRSEVIYPVSNPELTIPRVASTPAGHAVTVRSGGKAGKVLVGFLDQGGQKKGDLFPVPGTSDFVGMPAIAANETTALVTFAARGANDPGWGIAASRVKWGLAPTAATRISVPAGGPGGEAISPSVAALPSGRWLLTWTEGSSGNRVVRTEMLGPDLEALSAPLTLSPEGSNAGQAVLWTAGEGALALFYVLSGQSQQLWATGLECSP